MSDGAQHPSGGAEGSGTTTFQRSELRGGGIDSLHVTEGRTAMKTMFAIVAALLITCMAQAQDVPARVRASFEKKYANAENVSWDVNEDGEYIALFSEGTAEMSARYDEGGNWLSTTVYLDQEQTPASVQKSVAKQFPEYEMYDVIRVESPTGSWYEATLESEDDALIIQINADGKILKRESIMIDME